MDLWSKFVFVLFFSDTATTELYTYRHTLSRHDALPIWPRRSPIIWRSSNDRAPDPRPRRRHHLDPLDPLRARRHDARRRAARTDAALSPPRLGRARRRRDLACKDRKSVV